MTSCTTVLALFYVLAMIRKGPLTSEEIARLDEVAALIGVSIMSARVKFATMPWHMLDAALDA